MRIRVIVPCLLATVALACGEDNPVGPRRSGRAYLLSGSVTEPVGVHVEGLTLRIVDSERTILLPNSSSYFRVGVAEGPVTIEVSKEGYHPKTVPIDVRGATTQDVEILPVTPPAAFSGPFWMTLSADPAACGALPPALRTRRYAVDVDQAGAGLVVHLSDPRLRPGGRADGRVHGTTLWFDFRVDNSFGYSYIVEEPLDDTRSLVVSATVEGTVGSSGAAGQLTGTWEVIGPEGSPRCEGEHAARFDRR